MVKGDGFEKSFGICNPVTAEQGKAQLSRIESKVSTVGSCVNDGAIPGVREHGRSKKP